MEGESIPCEALAQDRQHALGVDDVVERHQRVVGVPNKGALSSPWPAEEMTVSAEEFIRRFLIHVPPSNFQRIRYYGFLGNRYRAEKLAQCRRLLAMAEPQPVVASEEKDYRDRYEELTGVSLCQCPVCNLGRMMPFRTLPPITSAPPSVDTS